MYQLKNLINLLIGYGKKLSKQPTTLKSSGFTPRFIKHDSITFYHLITEQKKFLKQLGLKQKNVQKNQKKNTVMM